MYINRIFQNDVNLNLWSIDFLNTTGGTAAADFGLTAAQVQAFADLQADYAEKLAKCTNVEARSQVAVVAKNTSKSLLVALARQLVDVCDAWPMMTNDKRVLLRIPLRTTTRTPAKLPTLPPQVAATLTGSESMRLTVRNPGDPDRRAKPKGVASVVVQVCFEDDGVQPTTPAMDWPTYLISGKADVDLFFANMPAGKTAWFVCSWLSTRNERGPVSAKLSVRLPGTGFAQRPATAAQDPAMKIAA